MEPATRFDLEAAIQTWRANLSEELAGQADALAELEEHLRTSVTALREAGLSDEEAFIVASRRLGPTQELGGEFQRADPAPIWRRRIFWIALGGLTFQLWTAAANPIRTWFAMRRHEWGSNADFAWLAGCVLVGLVPIAVGIFATKSNLPRLFNYLGPIFATRRRAAWFLCCTGGIVTAAGHIFSLLVIQSRTGQQEFTMWPSFWVSSLVWLGSGLPLGLFAAWLMPSAPSPIRVETNR